MATQEKTWNVANRLHSQKDSDNPEVNHIIAGADEIYDDAKGAKQSDINAQTDAALADRYTKAETYSKEQLDSLITTPDVNYVTVVATNATTSVTDILPATGEANTIYRVGNWNGTQYDPTMYALYAWNGSAYVCLAARSFVGEVYDVSVNHPDGQGNPTPYADLTAALGTSGANIPADIRRGGMSIKFIQGTVQSSDNKYVQARFMLSTFTNAQFAEVSNWQGIEEEPTPNSMNMVKSGGIVDKLSDYDTSVIESVGSIEKIMNITVSGEHSSRVDRIKYNIPAGKYSVVINDVDSGNAGFFLYADYLDGTTGTISGTIFNMDTPKSLTIRKDIVSIGVYKGSGTTLGKISIKFTDENFVSKAQLKEVDTNLDSRIDVFGVTSLYAMQGTAPSGLAVGQCFFNTNIKKISYKTGESSYRSYTPTNDGLYRYNDEYYQWDGTTLVRVNDAYIKEREVFMTLLFLSTLKMKQGALNTNGDNTESTTQLRPDDSIYINGKYTLRLPDGYIFRRICSYSTTDKSLLGFRDPVNASVITIGTYNNSGTIVDCLTRFTIKKPDGSDITPDEIISRCYCDILNDKLSADKTELLTLINSNHSEFISFVDNNTESLPLVTGKTMKTGSAVGQTASFEEATSAGWRYIKRTVKAGEIYFIKNALSGTNPKAVTLTDANGVITKVQTSGSFTGLINIEVDGFLVVNGQQALKVAPINNPAPRNHTLNVLDTAGLYQGYLATDGGWGSSTYTIYSGIIRENVYMVLPDGFKFTRVVYYNKSTGAYSSKTELTTVSEANIYKEGCYARVGIKKVDDSDFTVNDFPVNNIGAEVQENTKTLNAEIDKQNHTPTLIFAPDFTWKDSFATELEGMSASLAKNTIPSDYLEKIYAKIDALIADNPDYITKYDAVELANQQGLNISYPVYANGVTEPITESITLSGITYDATYDVTPAYKTYIYKLSHVKNGLYGNNIKKRTIFITACTHGWEKAGSFDTYLLMKRLCEDFAENDFYMKLRSLFDIWIIPCLNGYGIYHGTRTNARQVNINRNAPSPGWRLIGTPGNNDFSGEPNSEFETKLVVHFIDTLKPDIYFDHHNFSPDSAIISFTSGISKLPCAPYFNALVNFNRCAIKYLPQHFGEKFNIIQSSDPNYYPNGSAKDIGELRDYAYDAGTQFAFVLEVDYAIPFTNGVYTGFTGLQANTDDTYRLNEYILRSQLIEYCNAVLNMTKDK